MSSNKTPTANFAARFEPSIAAQQIAPGRQPLGFARNQPPEHHAVTAQQRACDVFDDVGAFRCAPFSRQRPAAGVFDAEQRRAAQALLPVEPRLKACRGMAAAPIGRHQQGPQATEAIGIDQPLRNKLGERLLDLGA